MKLYSYNIKNKLLHLNKYRCVLKSFTNFQVMFIHEHAQINNIFT